MDGDATALGDDVRAWRGMDAAKHRANAREQLIGAERLGQVVIGPHVEGPHLVLLAAAGADHDDRRHATALQALEDLPTVDERKPDVEQDDVERSASLELARGGRAVAGGVRLVTVALEDRADRIAQGG